MKRQVKTSVGRSVGYSVGESVGEASISTAPTGTDLIDLNTGAVAAYSTGRRLRTNYTGALFRVRRSSDNAEQDIGFDAGTGLVDSAALATFVGVDDAFMVTWYDQSTSAINMTNATAASQPKIASAGAVVTLGTNSIVAAEFDSTANRAVVGAATLDMTTTNSTAVFVAGRKSSDAGFAILLTRGNATAGNSGAFRIEAPPSAATTLGFRPIGGSAPGTVTLASITAGTAFVAAAAVLVRAIGSQSQRMLRRGATSTTVSSSVSLQAADLSNRTLQVGRATDGFSGFNGECGEVIVFNTSARASVSSSIDSNLKTFWGIT